MTLKFVLLRRQGPGEVVDLLRDLGVSILRLDTCVAVPMLIQELENSTA